MLRAEIFHLSASHAPPGHAEGSSRAEQSGALAVARLIPLCIILLVGLALRLINLSEPYWGDEVLSLDIVQHFQKARDLIIYLRTVEVHPPLYYLVLHYWTAWFGVGEYAVRLPSVAFGLGVVALSYRLGDRLFKPRVGLVAAALVAVLPMQLASSQEARPYIMVCFFALLNTLMLWEYLENRRIRYLVGYIGSASLGLYLHYSYLYVIAALGTFWVFDLLMRRRFTVSHIRDWLVTDADVWLLFYWWLSTLLFKWLLGRYLIFDLPRTIGANVRSLDFMESVTNQLVWFTKGQPVQTLVIAAVLIAKLAIVGLAAWVGLARLPGGQRANEENGSHALLFMVWLIVAPLLLFMFSPLSLPYTGVYERHVLVVSVFFMLLLASLIVRLDLRQGAVLAALFLVSLLTSVTFVLGNDALWDPDHRLSLVAEYVNEQYRPGDLVVTQLTSARSDLNHWLRPELSAIGFYPVNYYGQDIFASRQTLGLVENEVQFRLVPLTDLQVSQRLDRLVKMYKPKRIWLVYFGDVGKTAVWFATHRWRHAFQSPGPLFLVDLYVHPPSLASE